MWVGIVYRGASTAACRVVSVGGRMGIRALGLEGRMDAGGEE
jgi:hypothetical protein